MSKLSPLRAFSLLVSLAACGGGGGGGGAGSTGSAGSAGGQSGGGGTTTSTGGNAGTTTPTGGAAGTTTPTGGMGGTTTPTGGTAGTTTPTGGTAGGNAGSGGAAGGAAAGTGGATTAVDPSPGCDMAPAGADSPTAWVKKDLAVTGVDTAFTSKYPPNANTKYNWTSRNYFMRIPSNYDTAKPYPLTIGMSGCGGPETVGSEGGYSPLGTGAAQSQAIQVAMSYVLSTAASADCNGAVFADDFVNTPDQQYLEAVVKDVGAKYCIDRSRVFLSGYSSGAFEAVTLGLADSDLLRGYGVQIGGGLRLKHPPFKDHPTAAFYVVGLQDTENPIGPLTTPLHDSLGTAPGRDESLTRNGCQGTATAPWDAAYPMCVKYTGCPAKYPVVWCAITSGHLPTPNDPAVGKYRYEALWKFFSTLP